MGLLRMGDRVLLVHRRPDREWYPDVWDVPGGHIDPGEHPADALVRELSEELGIQVERPTGPPDDVFRDAAQGLEGMIWIIDNWVGTADNIATDEHDAIGWFHAADLVSLRLVDQALSDLVHRALTAGH